MGTLEKAIIFSPPNDCLYGIVPKRVSAIQFKCVSAILITYKILNAISFIILYAKKCM